ncbi:MAG: SAM-dependent methyltransferase [Armatimonadetes bacterium]|nr:SAM-dependent methyltransferase [Armatimonadota bacterium]
MDKSTRNTLRNAVTKCRWLLEDAVGELLEGRYGIHKNGTIESADALGALSEEESRCRERVLARLAHLFAAGDKKDQAVARLVREIAFTHLNRLVAYKMMEERGLIREAVSRGMWSQGFQFFLADNPEEAALRADGREYLAYCHFLDSLGSGFSSEIAALFSDADPANGLYTSEKVLLEVLGLINQAELESIWAEDEAIGWVYQYFTPKELRDQARKNPAPRNSCELAFLNQFYTPRYVVEFLVDNTLGRLWHEMCGHESALADGLKYLALPGNRAYGEPAGRRVREARDARTIKVLDPACGSAHFLLYCFDLFERIYLEAYDHPQAGPQLRTDFPDAAQFRRAIPGLILHHNLHGIDIDPRSVQISALALWLRAQRSYMEAGIGRDDRPPITRANVVCAEPMPGEIDLLNQFTQDLEPPLLRQLVRDVFGRMKLASEAGSLLRIEEELRASLREAKAVWLGRPREEQLELLPELRAQTPAQLSFDVSGITDAEFWDSAEERVLDALRRFAEQAGNGTGYLRRLFADDAARGFAFIDLCSNRYDVVLMNPPFGAASQPSKAYIEKSYPRTKNDVYAAFVERGLQLLKPGGFLGAITSRTGFFLSSFEKWRNQIVLGEAHPTVFADLGYGVLDTAMVETAAYCLEKR